MSLPFDVDCAMDGPTEIPGDMKKLQSNLLGGNQDDRFDSGIESFRSVDSSSYCFSVDRESALASIDENSSLSQHLDSLHISPADRVQKGETRTELPKFETIEDEDEAYVEECDSVSGPDDSLRAAGTTEKEIHHRSGWGHLTDDAFDQDQEGDTPLHLAIIHKEVEIALRFIYYAEDAELLDISNDLLQTPLHLSVLTRQPEICRALILANAQVDPIDRNGDTPLHIACKLKDDGCIRALTEGISPLELQRGLVQTVRVGQLPQNLEMRNFEGFTCVHIAGFVGSVEHLTYLYLLGANINAPDGKSGRTVLHNAVEAGNLGLTHHLIAKLGANVDALTFDQCTPLHIAVGRGLKAIMMLLMQNQADMDITNFEGERPCDLSHDRELMMYIENSVHDDTMYTDIKIQGQ